jgi:hypothetical protein
VDQIDGERNESRKWKERRLNSEEENKATAPLLVFCHGGRGRSIGDCCAKARKKARVTSVVVAFQVVQNEFSPDRSIKVTGQHHETKEEGAAAAAVLGAAVVADFACSVL